jgi:hypothetical protein
MPSGSPGRGEVPLGYRRPLIRKKVVHGHTTAIPAIPFRLYLGKRKTGSDR